jgi:LuxR family transcriptional regulator, maltose regulon positive regulatory protein
MAGTRRASKFVAPRPARSVHRARVLTAIERALRSGICWVAAPAGYGKTTAVVEYLHRRDSPHVWYRADEGDQDIASFFHHLAASLPRAGAARGLPVFGAEYADQPREFARRFARAWFERLRDGTVVVFDDLHYADAPQFHAVLAVLLREIPGHIRGICISRTLPPDELGEIYFQGRMTLVDQAVLQFSDREARQLVANRMRRRPAALDVSIARGWAAGLVLIADRAAAGDLRDGLGEPAQASGARADVFAALAKYLFDALNPTEQETLLKLGLLTEITPELAAALAGKEATRTLLARLQQRQLLITRGDATGGSLRLHDLLREFLQNRLIEHFPARELAQLRERAAMLLHEAGQLDAAIHLALQAKAWPLAHRLLAASAETLLAQGRRATFVEWCAALPQQDLDAWLCYWLGVAHMADDAAAEAWFARAWDQFAAQDELDGLCLTAARAVLSKTDSWRTHEGLATWTQRAIELIDRESPRLSADDQLLAWAGMLRAVDYAADYRSDGTALARLRRRLLERLARRRPLDSPTLRLMASQSLIEHAGSTGEANLFERAVDSVAEDLRSRDVQPWALGMWLVAFGSVTSRYFTYGKRGFPYASPEEALRAAVALGEREALRGVEFGGLYHLQLLMKMRNDWSEFGALIARIAQIADSRHTTQVAVAADCQAALHTRQGRFAEAHAACSRVMAAIEAANEPPIERWPHFITQFEVLLAERRPAAAAGYLDGVIGLFDGAVRQRTSSCVLAARAFEAKWADSPQYPQHLQACMEALRTSDWSAALINLPGLLAELCADALELGLATGFCNGLIRRRSLLPPARRPGAWPWPLRLYVLGGFQLQVDAEPLNAGNKAPTRSLDILRVLAVSRKHTCALEDLHELLWPDADGAQAKAACEQALHRLRKLLVVPNLLVQREGKLQLSPEHVWVDLEAWERSLREALRSTPPDARELQQVFEAFGGPLLHLERATAWSVAATERVRSKYIDLTLQLGRLRESTGDHAGARRIYLRAIDHYPTSAGCYEGLIRGRLAQHDGVGALEDYQRYQRMLLARPGSTPSPAIRALIDPLLP